PYSDPMPLLAWGGRSAAAARRAGRYGLAFLPQTHRPELQQIYEDAARASGHEPGMCLMPPPEAPLIVFVNDDVDEGWREVGPCMLVDAISYHDWNEASGTV